MRLDETTTERPAEPFGRAGGGAGDTDSFSQYVTFHLGEECFAFPMAAVLEIIRVPATVGVPLTPRGLVGLANLRGTVLPVVDLRRTLGLGERPYDDATRVIVVDCGRPVGLVVDRVARVLNVEPDRIEASDRVGSILDVDLLTGVVKNTDGHDLIQLVDAARVVELEFKTIAGAVAAEATGAAGLARGEARGEIAGDVASGEDDTMQLVSVVVDGEEYAFQISEVDEIVRVPEKISHVPHADGHVLGLINLRNRLLPLVSLRRIFRLAEVDLDENFRVIVVRLAGSSGEHERVGIVVDQVREVLRVSAATQDQMPSILARGTAADQISAVCRLDGGKRLVCILSAAALFDHPALRQAIELERSQGDDAAAGDAADAQTETDAMDETDETQLVVYQLARQEYGVDIQSVQEIIRVPESLNRVPKTPEFVEGMINLRGTVLPVVEMRLRFGIARLERNDRQRILVLNTGGVRTGFIVDQVAEVLRVPRAAVERAPKLSEEQDRMIGEVANLDDGKRMVLVLDAEALLDAHERAALDPEAADAPAGRRRRMRPGAARDAAGTRDAGHAG
jgi:purine-binding chemotaxis protein CheW